MATESVSAGEFQELAVRYEALERQANNLLAAMSRGRAIRNVLLLALLVLVGALSFTIYQMGNRLRSEKFMIELSNVALARTKANEEAVKKQLLMLYEKSNPILMQAFQKQAEKDQPKYVAAAEKEWPVFQKDLEKRFEERLLDQYKNAIAAGKPELERICPELKGNPEQYKKLEEGLFGVAERMVDKYYTQNIPPRFAKLDVNWRTYPAAAKSREDEPSIGMQIVGHLYELLAVAFAKGDALAAVVDMPEKKPPVRQAAPTNAPTKTGTDTKKGG
jgi:hypothetical protein